MIEEDTQFWPLAFICIHRHMHMRRQACIQTHENVHIETHTIIIVCCGYFTGQCPQVNILATKVCQCIWVKIICVFRCIERDVKYFLELFLCAKIICVFSVFSLSCFFCVFCIQFTMLF